MSHSEDKRPDIQGHPAQPNDLQGSDNHSASEDDRELGKWMGGFLPDENPSAKFSESLRRDLASRMPQPSAHDESSSAHDDSSSAHDQPSSILATDDSHRSRWQRVTWGFLAAAASVLAMVFWPAPVAYSFETMRSQLSEQEFVRANVRGPGESLVGWVSQQGDFVAVEASDSVAVTVRGKRMIRFLRQDGVLTLASTTADRDTPSATRLLRVLNAVQESGPSDLAISKQSWRRVSPSQNVDIELDIVFRDTKQTGQEIPVRFGINSETGLPESLTLLDDDGAKQSTLSLGYPKVGPTDLAALGIPRHLAAKANRNTMPGSDSAGFGDGTGNKDPMLDEIASLNPPPIPMRMPPGFEAPELQELDGDISRIVNDPRRLAALDKDSDAKDLPTLQAPIRFWQAPLPVEVPTSVAVMSNQIDFQLGNVWKENQLSSQPSTDNYTLYRRLHLDLTGRIPRVAEIRRWATEETLPVDEVVESLLDSADFDSNMAAVWTRWLLPPDVELEQFGGEPAFMTWLSDQFSHRVPYDEIVRQLLTAEGRVGDAGPVLFTTALEMKPEHLAKQTSRAFLGTRIDCAMCHDHPYDDWTQTDFWAYAALFARISRPKGKMNAMSSVLRVKDVGYGEVNLPDTEIVVPPRFLGGDNLVEEPDSNQRRRALADWLTDPSNQQFARATVNLVWSHFFGAGLVEPRDDFGSHNAPLSPELLDQLAAFFIDSGYDVRSLVRSIVRSDAYAQSSLTRQTDGADTSSPRPMFDSMPIRWLNAGQLYDCLQVASGGLAQSNPIPEPTFGLVRIDNASRDQFIQEFGNPSDSALEFQSGIPQALSLMNGPLANLSAGEDTSRLLKGLQAPFFSDRDRIETVFLSLVSRPPNAAEVSAINEMIEAAPDTPVPVILSDLVWALLNSAEFATNH